MATLDEMKLEGPEVKDKILAQVYRLDQNAQRMGLGPFDAQQLRYAYDRIKQGVVAIVQAKKAQALPRTGQAPPTPTGAGVPPQAPGSNLPLSTFAEGGDIADSSGIQTQQVRNRLGIS